MLMPKVAKCDLYRSIAKIILVGEPHLRFATVVLALPEISIKASILDPTIRLSGTRHVHGAMVCELVVRPTFGNLPMVHTTL